MVEFGATAESSWLFITSALFISHWCLMGAQYPPMLHYVHPLQHVENRWRCYSIHNGRSEREPTNKDHCLELLLANELPLLLASTVYSFTEYIS